LLIVNRSINFDDDPSRVAVEISDEPVDHLLPPEMKPAQSVASQPLPEELLFDGRRRPHLASPHMFRIGDPLPDHNVAT
jgi:hypothetical protein